MKFSRSEKLQGKHEIISHKQQAILVLEIKVIVSLKIKLSMNIKKIRRARIFTLIIFLFVCSVARSQFSTYHNFPEQFAAWGYLEFGSSSQCVNNVCDTELVYQQSFDIMIAGNSYHQLFKDGMYIGGLREDSSAKRIYYFPFNDVTEYLLYDFNVSVGDTVHTYTIGCGGITATVTSIDSTNQFSPDYRKVIHFQAPVSDWVEGIGCVGGLLAPGCNGVDFSWELICFKVDSNFILSGSTPAVDCDIINSVKNNSSVQNKLYPSIIERGSPMHISIKDPDGAELIISNTIGKIIKREKLKSALSDILTDDFPTGIFTVTIISSNGRISLGKFVVVEK